MIQMYADLHIHSTFSDGTDTPAELLSIAEKNGISVVAIADHDTVDGVKAAHKADSHGVRLIPAIEVSTVSTHRFLHVLGYHVNVNSTKLAEYIEQVSKDKTENTRINFEYALSKGTFAYDWERVLELNRGQRRLSGVHVVKAMELDGYHAPGMTMREMFHKHFRPESPLFIETEKATVADAINIIEAAGGVPVIAHPKLVHDDDIVMDMIKLGAKGIEVYYPLHTPQETEKYLRMAREHGLLVTGGSDWHGGNSAPEVTHMGVAGLENGEYPILNYSSMTNSPALTIS
jgi:3',5'-nucleoside bisphosphate phosphatase